MDMEQQAASVIRELNSSAHELDTFAKQIQNFRLSWFTNSAIERINQLDIDESELKQQQQECKEKLEMAKILAEKFFVSVLKFFIYADLDLKQETTIKESYRNGTYEEIIKYIHQMQQYLEGTQIIYEEFNEKFKLAKSSCDGMIKKTAARNATRVVGSGGAVASGSAASVGSVGGGSAGSVGGGSAGSVGGGSAASVGSIGGGSAASVGSVGGGSAASVGSYASVGSLADGIIVYLLGIIMNRAFRRALGNFTARILARASTYLFSRNFEELEKTFRDLSIELEGVANDISNLGSSIDKVLRKLKVTGENLDILKNSHVAAKPDDEEEFQYQHFTKAFEILLEIIRKGYTAIQPKQSCPQTSPILRSILNTDQKYPGVLFFEVSITKQITSSGSSINQLEDMGVSLTVPEGSISSSCEHIDLDIRPCFSGPFKLPPGYESASPVYLITSSRKINFLKDIIVRIYHNACLWSEEDCEDMAFFSASFKPQYIEDNQPVYTFKKIDGTNTRFKKGEQVGEISLRHFCGVKIGKRKRSSENVQVKKCKEDLRYYSANLYPTTQHEDNMIAIFCMCQRFPLHMKFCDQIISKQWTDHETRLRVEKKTEVSCIITGDDVEVKSACTGNQTIIFDKEPSKIRKRDIDDIQIKKRTEISQLMPMFPPKLKLYATQLKQSHMPRVEIIGLNEKLMINIPVTSTQDSKEEREERPQAIEHSKVASIDDSDLDVDDDLEDVLEAVKSLANEWKTLLTRLHIKLDTLQTIHSNNPKDIISCLHIGLSKWLKMNYDYERHGRPSWRMLAMAVSDIDNRLFEKIAKDHPKK